MASSESKLEQSLPSVAIVVVDGPVLGGSPYRGWKGGGLYTGIYKQPSSVCCAYMAQKSPLVVRAVCVPDESILWCVSVNSPRILTASRKSPMEGRGELKFAGGPVKIADCLVAMDKQA